MSITSVRGNSVDCHTCRATFTQPTEHAAHAFAAAHAQGHMTPRPVLTPITVQQNASYPRYAKTGINHTPHILLDLFTCGCWIPVHITLAILGGRKTKFR